MEKRTPHCPLSVIKTLIEAGKVRTTHAARSGQRFGAVIDDVLIVSFKEL